jgi:hypothetical protein
MLTIKPPMWFNGQMKKDKKTKYDPQNTTQKIEN